MISSLAQGFDSDFLEVARKREHHQTDSTKSMARSGRAVIPLVLAVALLASSVFRVCATTQHQPLAQLLLSLCQPSWQEHLQPLQMPLGMLQRSSVMLLIQLPRRLIGASWTKLQLYDSSKRTQYWFESFWIP